MTTYLEASARWGVWELPAALLPAGSVRTADPVTLLDPGGADRPALVETAAGEREADLVVGADGLRSGVRRALFPSHPGTRYAGFTTWRMLAPAPATPFAPHETWGTGRLWGSHPLADGRVYAYAAATAPAGDRAPDREHAELLRRFGNWHHPVPAILAATEPADVLRHDVHTLAAPLPALHRCRTVLLGDAAHPMAPNLGQGGNQAIEDAVVLGHHCAPHTDVIEATARYTADRAARTARVVRLSARAARLTLASSPVTAAARAALVAAAG
ncbi:FAD-dependent monooxygenase, partial [Streptomyces sparsus]